MADFPMRVANAGVFSTAGEGGTQTWEQTLELGNTAGGIPLEGLSEAHAPASFLLDVFDEWAVSAGTVLVGVAENFEVNALDGAFDVLSEAVSIQAQGDSWIAANAALDLFGEDVEIEGANSMAVTGDNELTLDAGVNLTASASQTLSLFAGEEMFVTSFLEMTLNTADVFSLTAANGINLSATAGGIELHAGLFSLDIPETADGAYSWPEVRAPGFLYQSGDGFMYWREDTGGGFFSAFLLPDDGDGVTVASDPFWLAGTLAGGATYIEDQPHSDWNFNNATGVATYQGADAVWLVAACCAVYTPGGGGGTAMAAISVDGDLDGVARYTGAPQTASADNASGDLKEVNLTPSRTVACTLGTTVQVVYSNPGAGLEVELLQFRFTKQVTA